MVQRGVEVKCSLWSLFWEVPLFGAFVWIVFAMNGGRPLRSMSVYLVISLVSAAGGLLWKASDVANTLMCGMGVYRYVADESGLSFASLLGRESVDWADVREITEAKARDADRGGWYKPFSVCWERDGRKGSFTVHYVPFRWKYEQARAKMVELAVAGGGCTGAPST